MFVSIVLKFREIGHGNLDISIYGITGQSQGPIVVVDRGTKMEITN